MTAQRNRGPQRVYRCRDLPHLIRRTASTLGSRKATLEDEEWLMGLMNRAECELFERLSPADRAHALSCARYAQTHAPPVRGETPLEEVVVASALHDVGKVVARLGVTGRMLATVCGLLIGARAQSWPAGSGFRGRVRSYLDHSALGAELLAGASSSALAVAWAREHHLDSDVGTVDPALREMLKLADDTVGRLVGSRA